MNQGIRDIKVMRRSDNSVSDVRITFGPHHFIELHSDFSGNVEFIIGATHHGVKADASNVPSELETMIGVLRSSFPDNLYD